MTIPEVPTIGMLSAFPEKGKPKGTRLNSAVTAMSIRARMKQDDLLSARNRMLVQSMIDGDAPYSDSALRAAGAGFRYNLNFGEAAAMLEQALTAYDDLLDSVSSLIRVKLDPSIGDAVARGEMETVIADEWTRMVRGWNEFPFMWSVLSSQFVTHGLAIGYFPDTDGWKFEVGGWDNFCIPRGTRAAEEKIDILCADKDYLPHELYAFIQNEKAAADVGWNVEEVKRALVSATKYGGKRVPPTWGVDWAEFQRQVKGNDLGLSYTNTFVVHTTHHWVREYDGSISHYITPQTGYATSTRLLPAQDFLFKKENRYSNASQAFTVFTLGVGNGTYHSIRGLGYRIYPYVQVSNRMQCSVLDSTQVAGALLLQAKDPNGLDSAPITFNGPLAFLNSDVEVVERTLPNTASAVLPIIQHLQRTLQSNTPIYRARSGDTERSTRTKYEIQAQQELESSLSVSAVNFFYRAWDRLVREMFDRTVRISILMLSGADPEAAATYPEVAEFLTAIQERGVDPRYLVGVEHVAAERAVGLGSPAQRLLAFDEALQMVNTMDEPGRHALMRDRLAARFSRDVADRYMPASPEPRPVIDTKIAQLENGDMFGGMQIDPMVGENDAVHAEIHMQSIADTIKVLEDWRNGGDKGDITQLQPQIAYLALLIPHTERHVQNISQDPTRKSQYGMLRKALQEYNAMWVTYVRELQAEIQRRQDEQQAAQTPDPQVQMALEKQRVQIEQLIEKNKLNQQLKVADVQQRMQLRKAESDARIANTLREGNAKLRASGNEAPENEFVGESPLPSASSSDIVRPPLWM